MLNWIVKVKQAATQEFLNINEIKFVEKIDFFTVIKYFY